MFQQNTPNYFLQDEDGQTSLMVKCQEASYLAIKAYVELCQRNLPNNDKEQLVNIQDNGGMTALHWIVQISPMPSDQKAKIVRILVGIGAKCDMHDKDGQTPLILAAINGHQEAVVALLDAGATVNVADETGMTALSWAADKEHTDIMSLLLDRGCADINHKDI